MRSLIHAGLCAALWSGAAGAVSLSELQWDYRVIAVFATTDMQAAAMRDTLEHRPGIDERDVAWFVLAPNTTHSNLERRADREALLERHQADGFEVVLIGKDGTVKARQTDALDLDALFEAIDAMPMRQREMRERS